MSNWRERRPPPVAMTPPAPAAQRVTPDLDAAAYAVADAGEDLRARRTRILAVAAVVATLAIGAMVVYSTGIGGFFGARPGGEVQANGTSASAGGSSPATTPAPATEAQPGAAHGAPAVRPGAPVYGLQVASFRTAGRATRVLHDYVETTGLPGEVLLSEIDGDTWYRIVLGRFADETTARAASEDLLGRSLIAEAIVIPYTPQNP